MRYTVKDFLASGKFSDIKLLNNSGDTDREITGIRIIEVPDIEKYLTRGGELLLTSLKVFENTSHMEFLEHLEKLCEKNISGILLRNPEETEWQTDYCDILLRFFKERRVPVMLTTESFNYWTAIKYVINQIFDTESGKMFYFKIMHDNLCNVLKKGTDKGSIQDILYQISLILNKPVALYRCDFSCIAATASDMLQFEIKTNIEEYDPGIITQYQYMRQKREYTEYVEIIELLGQKIYFVVSDRCDEMETLDFIALENVAILLPTILMRSGVGQNVLREHDGDLEYRLLNGSLTSDEEDEVAEILELSKNDHLRVVTFMINSRSGRNKFTGKQTKETKTIENIILQQFSMKYIYSSTNRIIYIHKKKKDENEFELRRQLEKMQQNIQQQLNIRNSDIELLIGLGKTVEGYYRLKNSFEDSKTALKYIEVIRNLVGDKEKSVVDCSELGFFRLFTDIEDRETLKSYIPESLYKLYQYDRKKAGELTATLECFLNNNQSLKKTSQQLFIHYRSVSYRLEKIKKISGMDFDNPTEMLAVRNGLIIIRIFEAS